MKTTGISYYHDIYHLPMLYWDLLNKTGDLTYLLKDRENGKFPKRAKAKDDKSEGENRLEAEVIYNRIYKQYIDVFGLGKKQEEWIELKKQEANFVTKSYEKGGKHFINFARLKELEAKELLESMEGGNLNKTNAMLSKYYGTIIKPAEVSVYDYIGLINEMNSNG